MKKSVSRILCLVLCAVMVCSVVPMRAFATEAGETGIQPRSITTGGYNYYEIENFEDLKQIAAGTYSEITSVNYVSDAPLTISENLVMPENLQLDLSGTEVVIPAGVTLELNGTCWFGSVTINGTLISRDYMAVEKALTVNGEMANYSVLVLENGAPLVGEDKITHEGEGYMLFVYNVENDTQLKDALKAAEADGGHEYVISAGTYVEEVDISISEDLSVSENVILTVSDNACLTVEQGCTLTVYGRLVIGEAELIVNGTLNNLGNFVLSWTLYYSPERYAYGFLTMGSTGCYTGDGLFEIIAGDEADYTHRISGLDMTMFTVETVDYGWILHPKATVSFVDIMPDAYYYDAVIWAAENGITAGYGADGTLFKPDLDCTRAQVVTFLWRAAGSPEPTTAVNPFADVSEDSWYYKAVLWAAENGITAGYGAGGAYFKPDLECTRAQVVTFLHRAAGAAEPVTTANPFADVSEDSWYYKAVLWAAENGITAGYGAGGTQFRPDLVCSRGQIVTFLYRAYN